MKLKMQLQFVELKTPASLAAVREIADEVWPETFRSILSEEQIRYMMNMMYAPDVMEQELAEGYRFELVRANQENAGYIVCSPCPSQPDTMKLHKLYLRSRFHGQGIGQQMLDHACEVSRELGFQTLRLNVNKQNSKAIKAYNKNGFKTVEAVKNPIGSGFFMDDFVMEKKLR